MSDSTSSKAYVWFDSEFTSLEEGKGFLLQVALIVTDCKLKRMVAPELDVNIAVQLPVDAEVSPWVMEHIPDIVAVSRSDTAWPVERVDAFLVERMVEAVGPISESIAERPVLAGNSIHADRKMIRRWLPRFEETLHYRMLDVSSWKIGWVDQFGQEPFDKENEALMAAYLPSASSDAVTTLHDASYDVRASIAEYRYYMDHLTLRKRA